MLQPLRAGLLLCLAFIIGSRAQKLPTIGYLPNAEAKTEIRSTEQQPFEEPRDILAREADPDVFQALVARGDPNKRTGVWAGSNNTVVLSNLPVTPKRSIEQVNKDMPVLQLPTQNGTVDAKPVVRQMSRNNKNVTWVQDGVVHAASVDPTTPRPKRPAASKAVVSSKSTADRKSGPVHSNVIGNLEQVLNQPGTFAGSTGQFLELIVGVRVSTPFFGFGFNFCIDRWISSWPKVGIVIPNPVAWLLPEFLEVAGELQTTLHLPSPQDGTAPLGARISPTSDGFLLWLPSIQPYTISNWGFRYGVQISQLFGVDFGFGWTVALCAVDFVRV